MGVRAAEPARWLRPLAVASLVSNIAIVVTGGAVRLTGSGLGCPTWPRCTQASFVPHGELGMHAAIEFGNRMMTFVLAAVAVATWVAAMRARPRRRSVRALATGLALGIPGQALIGGVTVLTDLNPWVVSLHLMLSMAMTGLAVLLVRLVHEGAPLTVRRAAPSVRGLAAAVVTVTFVVLYLGTVVTGAGPHAGHLEATDLEGNQVFVVRNGLDPQVVSHVHAAFVYLLVALTVATLLAAHRTRAPRDVRTAALVLLAVELGQGTVGFTQYFQDLPVLLVGIHLLGAALLTACASWLLVSTRGGRGTRAVSAGRGGSAQQRVDRDREEQQREVEVGPVEQPHRP
ncbi:MAG: COX15/CtaA family protein [Actinomycetota bacterium]|nr:COX15/CtaA family protein [Actinomycetota bacterium]